MTKIEITSTSKQETAFCKRITLTREGTEYSVLLFWDTHHGYDLTFLDNEGKWISLPDWAVDWEESQQYGFESLEYTLDSMSEEIKA
jgi:hypothetical protein